MRTESSPSVLRAIWIAFTSATVLYVAIAIFIGSREGADPELVRWIAIFMGIASGTQILVVFLLKQMVAGAVKGSYQTFCIMRWAMLESIAIYGLILRILGADWTVAGSFMVVSILTMLLTPPTEGERSRMHELE